MHRFVTVDETVVNHLTFEKATTMKVVAMNQKKKLTASVGKVVAGKVSRNFSNR